MRTLCYILIALLSLSTFVAKPMSAQETAPSNAAGEEAYKQLQDLLEVAPVRSLGSPGNAVIDKLVRDRFQQAVLDKSPAETIESIRAQRKVVLEAEDRLLQAQLDQLRNSDITEGQISQIAREALQADIDLSKLTAGQWQSGRIAFDSAVYVPGKATITSSGKQNRLYQLAPNLVDPGNLPEKGFEGRLIYVGRATPQELSGVDLKGAAVLIEFNSYNRWLEAIQLGAQVVIVLEPKRVATHAHATTKFSQAPISIPRFYMKRADMLDSFGEDWQTKLRGDVSIKIDQEPGRWESRTLYSDWLFVPAATSAPQEQRQSLVHVQAYKDADAIAPELAHGAVSASNLVSMFRLIDQFKKQLPSRPVLISAVNAHTNGLAGENEFAYTAFAGPEAIRLHWAWLRRELARAQYVRDLYNQEVTVKLMERLRSDSTTVSGQSFKLKSPMLAVLRDEQNILRKRFNDLEIEYIDLRRNAEGEGSSAKQNEIREEQADIEAQIEVINEYMGLFNRFGLVTYYENLSPERQERVQEFFKRIAEKSSQQVKDLYVQQERLISNMALRRRLRHITTTATDKVVDSNMTAEQAFVQRYKPLPSLMGICLDVSFGSTQLGFFTNGTISPDSDKDRWANDRSSRLARYTVAQAEMYSTKAGRRNHVVNTLRDPGGLPASAFLGSNVALGSQTFHVFDRTGITLTGARDGQPRVFTPHDTIDRINRNSFVEVMSWLDGYLPALINGKKLEITRQTAGQEDPLTVVADVRMLDEFSVGLPEKPLENAIIFPINNNADYSKGVGAYYGQVRPYPMYMTDSRGSAMLRCGMWRGASLQVYKYDDAYRNMTSTLDVGLESRYKSTLNDLKKNDIFKTRIIVGFDCKKVDLIGLTQPTNLIPIASMKVLDARQDAEPRHYSVGGMAVAGAKTMIPSQDGAGCVMMQPKMAFKLIAGLSLAINTTEEDVLGDGFDMDSDILPNLVVISAQDMWRLTEQRLTLLESKGVVNETARTFNDQAGEQAKLAAEAAAKGEYDKALTYSEKARGLAFWAYVHAKNTINDLIKAVVIFLALILPFCFFVTKLISPYTDINRQLVLFTVIFGVMAFLLWLLHPAFKVAETPLVVILGFIILGLAIFVAAILMGRFNASMNQAIEQMQQSESVDASQGRLAGVAFIVGVNNMKRRRIRTTLTCATIILVTFTMLSVISVGQDVEPAKVRVGSDAPYTGFLYSRPGLGPIDELQLRRLRAHFEDKATTVARSWTQRLGAFGEYLDYKVYPISQDGSVETEGSHLNSKVLLGLEPAEDGFLGPIPIISGGRWFSSASAQEILISVEAAALIGLTPDNYQGKYVSVLGRKLQIVGLVDDKEIEEMNDQGDVPLLPLISAASQMAQSQSAQESEDALLAEASGAASLEGGGDLLSQPGIDPARAIDVAFVPIDLAREFGDSEYRMLCVKYDNKDEPRAASALAWEDASELIRYQYARLDVGLQENYKPENRPEVAAGRYSVASSSATQVGGVLKVAIPIILTATIIFNTMLGSVMERRREVGIYNAIGLNPSHVIMFFLAESLVFGLVGSVAGYLIGQALSLFITHFDLLDLNLNYSSTSVILVIFLTIVTVLLSTVYPAMMAARAAVPSGQRRWSLPSPEGDEIHVQFPFSYDSERVKAVCAYLHDFMQQHSEVSTGNFLVRLGPVGRVDDPSTEEPPYCMLFDVAPAPFDLGVNQTMEVYAYYNHRVKAHMLAVHITRTSGEKGHWMTVNQPFLETLRKRLLGWRSQRKEIQETFYQRGEELFAAGGKLPPADTSASTSQGEGA